MTQGRWLAISVGTLTVALAFWFAVLAVPSDRFTGVAIFGVGLSFAMYAVAGFSRADDPMDTGFLAAITALGTGAALAAFAQVTGAGWVLAAAPVAAIGAGGARALAPTGDTNRNLARFAAMAAAVGIVLFVLGVDVTAYGLIAPLVPLPALGVADRLYDRGSEIVAEK